MQDTPDRKPVQTLIAFDYGLRRIGVAVGQRITDSASPLGTLANGNDGPDWASIERWVHDWQPGELVVGMPYNVDGSRSSLADAVESFIEALVRFGLPVHSVDERYSSLEAEQQLRSARARGSRGTLNKAAVDAAAAVLIAERWMQQQVDSSPGHN